MTLCNKVLGTTVTAHEGINAVMVTDKVWYYIEPRGWGSRVRVYKAIPTSPVRTMGRLSECKVFIEKYVGSARRLDPWSLRVSAVPAVIPLEEVALLIDHPLYSVKDAAQVRLSKP